MCIRDRDGIIPGGSKKNLDFYSKNVLFDSSIEIHKQLMIADAQTSGGLLMSVLKSDANNLIKILNKNSKYKTVKIGYFSDKKERNIIINNE